MKGDINAKYFFLLIILALMISGCSENNNNISKNPNDVILDTLITTYFNLPEWINNKRNLDITVDVVHLNIKGAKGLAALIMEEKK